MLARYSIFVFFLIFSFSCKESNFITVKDDKGKLIEKYKVGQDSKKHGPYTAYVDGKISEEATYQNGKLHGERKLYFDNGQVEIIEVYEDDVIVGDYKTYYRDGTLAQQATYVNGMMDGILKTYYKNSVLKDEVTMVENEENGPFKEYYDSGQLKWSGTFLNGDNEFGLLENYNESGQLVKKMMCDSLAICSTIWTIESGDVAPKKISK